MWSNLEIKDAGNGNVRREVMRAHCTFQEFAVGENGWHNVHPLHFTYGEIEAEPVHPSGVW